ncbi:ECF-type sigma factor [Streptomyces atacamensis]|uniref:ECF-type sigma factor n=1 Tax=Streptomyces atacamensis TaxID=531966 RepID=UPI00399CC08C
MPDGICEGRAPRGVTPRGRQATAETNGFLYALEEDLAGAEGASARVQRREADAALVEFLRRRDFSGPHYRTFTEELMEYGWRTLSTWSATGRIFDRAADMGRPIPPDMLPTTWTWKYEDRTQVVTDTVIKGSALFREHGLIRGKWTPHGGASLTTYFVGAGILTFPAVYTRWYRTHRMGQAELDRRPDNGDGLLHAQRDIPDQRATDPVHAAALYDDIRRLRPLLPDEQLREALVWMALGYTQTEAAQQVGLTPKALERRLARARTKVSAGGFHRSRPEEGGAR